MALFSDDIEADITLICVVALVLAKVGTPMLQGVLQLCDRIFGRHCKFGSKYCNCELNDSPPPSNTGTPIMAPQPITVRTTNLEGISETLMDLATNREDVSV